MNRRMAVLAIYLGLAACGGGGRDNDDTAELAEPVAVDFYSDSIGAGYSVNVSPGERMAQIRPHWRIVDHSVNGLTLSALAPEFASLPRTAKYVPIALGINDANARTDNFEANLRSVIQQLLAEGRVPILTGLVGLPNPGPLVVPYNDITHRLAQQYSLQHAGWNEAYRPGDVSPDGLHRTQQASDRLTDLLVAAIERAVREEADKKR